MNGQEVSYTITLNDLISGKLDKVESHAHKAESAIHKLGERAVRVAETLGISFGIYKIAEFTHSSIEMAHQLGQAEAQVRAGLISTNHAAGVSYEELEASAKKFADTLPFTRAQIVDMQSQIITFPGITKRTFETASEAIMDMSTRLHKGLDETAIMVGKALQDPAHGITAMRRVGVNFNEEQTKVIKNLVHTGHVAKAQALILKELQTEFAGSAKAAAAADPLFRYNKLMENLKIEVGEVGEKLIHNLTPALETGVQWIKNIFEVVENNKTLFIDLAGAIVGGAVAYGAYLAVMKGVAAYEAMVNGIKIVSNFLTKEAVVANIAQAESIAAVTVAQEGLNVAMAMNPIGAVIAGVGILVGLLSTAFGFWDGMFGKSKKVQIEHKFGYDTAEGQNKLGEFSDNVSSAADSSSKFADTMVSGSKKVAEQEANVKTTALNFENHLNNRQKDLFALLGSFEDHIAAKKKIEDAVFAAQTDFVNQHHGSATEEQLKHIRDKTTMAMMPKKAGGGKAGIGGAGGTGTSELASKATGSKVLNINIHIGALVKELKIQTTNFKEGVNKAQSMVTEALLSAVNDSQLEGAH